MKTLRGVEVQFHAFLTSALHTGELPASLPPGEKGAGTHLGTRLGGPQSRSGHSGGEVKKSQLLPGIEPLACLAFVCHCVHGNCNVISTHETPFLLRVNKETYVCCRTPHLFVVCVADVNTMLGEDINTLKKRTSFVLG
jgi:hypothetical protein